MPKKQGLSLTKKFIIVGGVLLIVQLGFILFYNSGSGPLTAREAIERAVAKQKALPEQRKDQLRVSLSISDFRDQQKRLPKTLDELVPKYFDSVPHDPATKKPFRYVIEGTRYLLGEQSAGSEGKGKSKAAPTDPGTITDAEQKALIASLTDTKDGPGFVYDPTGKRDPFRPFDVSPIDEDPNKTPLERYTFNQLKLTAVLGGADDSTAIVENAAGKGFTVKKGTKIGPNGGEVVEIHPDKIMVLETEVDFTGEKKTRTVEMRLRTKDQEEDQ